MPVQVLDVPLPIELPAKAPRKVTEDDPGVWALPLVGRSGGRSWYLSTIWLSFG